MFFLGINNFKHDIEMMVGKQHPAFWIYWYITWPFITPVAIIVSIQMFIVVVISQSTEH